MKETDELIYSRFLADHNEDDLKVLLERHKESLILFINGIVHDLDDAEELMLDAFAQAATGRSVFSGKSSFKTWLFSIGKKLALMHLRKKSLPLAERDENSWAREDLVEFHILREERNMQLYTALEQLPGDYRQILMLLYFEQMSMEEAAKVMGKTRKQVYHLADRGRKALKEKLERMGFSAEQYL